MGQELVKMSQQLLIGEALKYAAHNVPDREAFVDGDTRLTYREILNRAKHLAGWLQSQGIAKDDKVGCILKNGMPFAELYFGTSLSGGVFVPVNFRLVSKEIEYIINQSDIKILLVEEEFIDRITPIINHLPKVTMIVTVGAPDLNLGKDTITYESIYHAAANLQNVDLNDDDAHAIIYTSGTTGKPKGAVLTHKNLYVNGLNRLYHANPRRGIKQIVNAPLFHVAALATLVQNCLLEGTIHLQREFDPKVVLETIQNERINSMFMVPAMWNFLFQVPNFEEYDVRSMVTCATGGAICPLEIKKRIMEVFENAEILEAFGQTEMSPAATYLTGDDSLRKTDSVGKPSINVRVRVVDDEMNDVPVGEIGEIVYQGPTTMKEYYKNPEATKDAFKGGWFHSGDLVRMDEEGFIYVVDRKKDMIISGGENIYPKELEEVLYGHPDILEAAVIGVPDPDWGESVKAYIVMKPGKQLTKEEVIGYCQSWVASYKKPKQVEFLDALPRNGAGKVLKTVLRTEVYQK
ncbi:class I adenylate-forming enzyme family protein [Bacillus dakarensis]|uniref:class I adenylate-forming enzyme family protein n=1 Tax=Robertmurraya dakarensis TaxID=1926278 RepID=UPI000981DF1E|nr:long-chain fatty acid--CoA ligase [Bacillus dakarensis]